MKKIQKKLHITFLDFDDIKNPLLGAGQAKATLEVGKRLAEKGHKITVYCSKFPGWSDREENGITYKHISFYTKNIRVNNLIYIFSMPFIVPRIKADIIIECFTAPISTMFTPLYTKIPVIALTSSFEAERFTNQYHLPFNLVENFGLRFYKHIIALSEFCVDKIKKINVHTECRIIPEGAGKEYFQIKKRVPKHIFFMGRMDIGQKGIDLLLESYAKIANKAAYPLVIAGSGPDTEKVQALIDKLNLHKKVTMVGRLDGKMKEKFLAESLYVAFTSRNETFSCFALEALASELPLMAFDVPGITWTGNIVAKKVKPFDTDAYARLLLESMDRKKMSDLGKKARIFARRFTWEKVTNDFESYFFDVLGKESNV